MQKSLTVYLFLFACIVWSLSTLMGCGGGSSSGGGSGGGSGSGADFSISVQPTNISLIAGGSASVTISVTPIGSFTGQVNVSITGSPAGVSVAPSSLTLAASGQQSVTLAASSDVSPQSFTLAIAASSGTLSHNHTIAVGIDTAASNVHPPFRTRYIRTDAQWDYGFINFFPQHWITYDSATKRFFANNTTQNRIDVFDATTELQIASIAIPGPWVSDEAPDHSSLYVGTQVGDLYVIDPVAMAVTKRIPAFEIGPTGYEAYEVKVLADGKLVLLGAQGGIPAVDGYSTFALWNPADNSLAVFRSSGPGIEEPFTCDSLGNIAELTLTADRTKILISSADSDGTLCEVDPTAGTYVALPFGGFLPPTLTPPDGKELILAAGGSVAILDPNRLFITDQFQVGDGSTGYRYALSVDGNTLFAVPISGSFGLAINWRTHAVIGYFAAFTTGDLESWTTPQAVDESGLIAGVIGNGVSFLEGGSLLSKAPGLQVPNPSVRPTSGPVTGDTPTLIISDINVSRLKQVFFGNGLAEGATVDNLGIHINSPTGTLGPVDVAVTADDGGLELSPEWFSYGPWIVEVTPNAATAEGGGTATIYGYGLGPFGQGQHQSGLQVTIGGETAPIVQYLPTLATAALDPYYPFPLEGVVVTVPPGVPGTVVDIAVSNANGSYTARSGFKYLSATQQFPLSGAELVQGIYDKYRDVYYFTDQNQIRVFSRAQGQWLSPIPIPNAFRLWGVALSPDGSKLAVSDAGLNLIYLINPAAPTAVKSFPLPVTGADQGEEPAAVVITDSGIIYYASFYTETTGGWAFHKLNIATGVVTDYQWLQAGALADDAYTRVLLSSDNTRVYINDQGTPIMMDTATEDTFFNEVVSLEGDYEMTLSSNGTSMSGSEFLSDTNLNPQAFTSYDERETWNVFAVFGEKMSPDGNFLFSPLQNAIDVLDGKRGTLVSRVSLPFTLSPNYDALVDDGRDNVLIAITGQSGNGIAVIDLSELPEPSPLPYATPQGTLAMAHFVQKRVAVGAAPGPRTSVAVQNLSQNQLHTRIKHLFAPLSGIHRSAMPRTRAPSR